jgi:hypothetical protein
MGSCTNFAPRNASAMRTLTPVVVDCVHNGASPLCVGTQVMLCPLHRLIALPQGDSEPLTSTASIDIRDSSDGGRTSKLAPV